MRLIGLLSWYDEPVDLLTLAVTSARDGGCDHVVALDGRYATFDGPNTSPSEQARALRSIHGVSVYGSSRNQPWRDEMEKRTALFALGEHLTKGTDWYLVVDADTEYVMDRDRLRRALMTTDRVAGEIPLREDPDVRYQFRCLYRALRRIKVGPTHSTYVAADGTMLWGRPDQFPVDALDLTGAAHCIHRPRDRPRERLAGKDRYYRSRDLSGLESDACVRCGERSACLLPDDFRTDEDGGTSVALAPFCSTHARHVVRRNLLIARRRRIDPAWAARPRNATAAFLAELAAEGRRHGESLSRFGERMADAHEDPARRITAPRGEVVTPE